MTADFIEGDAEALPFDDGSFDVVTSVFGAMFAPDQERTASELARVCRPGGRIGRVAHTPDGFIGNLFKTNARHVPPPVGLALADPVGHRGATARTVRATGSTGSGSRSGTSSSATRHRPAYVKYWRRYYGPTLKTFETVGEAGRDALEADLLDLDRPLQPRRRRHDDRRERVPGGGHRDALKAPECDLLPWNPHVASARLLQ